MIVELVLLIISTVLIALFSVYCWVKLDDKKFDLKNKKILISWFVLSIGSLLISFLVPKVIKLFVLVTLLGLVNYFFITKKFDKCIAGVIIFEMLNMICETLLAAIIMFVTGFSAGEVQSCQLCIGLLSLGIPLILYLCMKTKIPYAIYNYLIKTFTNVRKYNLLAYFIAIIVLATIFMILTYIELPSGLVLVCNTILIIAFVVIVVKLINAKDKNRKITSKYETSIASLKQYEEMMDKYRIANHENKNQLLTIRNMVKTKDKKTLNYIDKILEHKIKDNENIFNKTAKIPEGGLRAIIYSKVCKMDELKIKYALDISNDVKANNLINLDEDTILNVCKILGVFLDNAIEAVQGLKKKNVFIELFMLDNNLCIDITNNYEGVIEIEKIHQKKYTTKGKGHGYGLSLVNDILKSDTNLLNEQVVSKDKFTQRLVIKL